MFFRLVLNAVWIAALSTSSIPALAQVSIIPAAPKALETIRVFVPEVFNDDASRAQSTYNTVDTRTSLVSMSGNQILVSLTMSRSDIPFGPSAAIDIPVGQFPAGNYEILVNRREPNGTAFGTVGLVGFTVSPRAAADPLWNHTDIWFDSREPGWGINLIQHGSGKIFATWFVYGADGKATWFVVPDGVWIAPTAYRGAVYRTTGPDYAACTTTSCPTPFDPSKVTVQPVGEIVLGFHPSFANNAALAITIDGKTVSKALQRQGF